MRLLQLLRLLPWAYTAWAALLFAFGTMRKLMKTRTTDATPMMVKIAISAAVPGSRQRQINATSGTAQRMHSTTH